MFTPVAARLRTVPPVWARLAIASHHAWPLLGLLIAALVGTAGRRWA